MAGENGSIPLWTEDTPEAAAQFDRETAEVDDFGEGEVIPPKPRTGVEDAEDDFPLEDLITPKVVGTTFSLPGLLMAKKTGHAFWKLDEEEIMLMGEAWQPVSVYLIKKYLGTGVGMFAAAIATTAAVYGPRWMQEQREAARAKKGKQPNQANPPDSSETTSASSSDFEDAESQSNSEDYSVTFRE